MYIRLTCLSPFAGPRIYLHNGYIESFQRELDRPALVTMREKGCGVASNIAMRLISENTRGIIRAENYSREQNYCGRDDPCLVQIFNYTRVGYICR